MGGVSNPGRLVDAPDLSGAPAANQIIKRNAGNDGFEYADESGGGGDISWTVDATNVANGATVAIAEDISIGSDQMHLWWVHGEENNIIQHASRVCVKQLPDISAIRGYQIIDINTRNTILTITDNGDDTYDLNYNNNSGYNMKVFGGYRLYGA